MNSKDTEFLEQIKGVCDLSYLIPIAFLKTPRVGEVVDSGMGVDFELKEYVLIYKRKKGSTYRSSEIFYMEPFDEKLKAFDYDNCRTLDGMIEELNSVDAYELLWKNDEYKPREAIKSVLEEQANTLTITFSKTYTLLISFDELNKYIANISNNDATVDTILLDALKDRPDFGDIVGNVYYPNVGVSETRLVDNGVLFIFKCHAKETLYDYKETPSEKAEVKLHKIVEHIREKFKDRNLLED